VLGPEHPDVASTLNNLAILLVEEGEPQEARLLHERALRIREKAFGPDHPAVAQSVQNLASAIRATGDYRQALTLYERALEIYRTALGPEHPRVAMTHYNVGCLLALQGESSKSLEQLRLAMALGFRNPAMAEDPDLASLRGLDAFQNLLADASAAN